MFRVEYWEERRGLDILLVAGLNNIKNDNAEKFMSRVKKFHQMIEDQEVPP